jgi:hypothetical protein
MVFGGIGWVIWAALAVLAGATVSVLLWMNRRRHPPTLNEVVAVTMFLSVGLLVLFCYFGSKSMPTP